MQVFLVLKISVRPAQWFEFDMPALKRILLYLLFMSVSKINKFLQKNVILNKSADFVLQGHLSFFDDKMS